MPRLAFHSYCAIDEEAPADGLVEEESVEVDHFVYGLGIADVVCHGLPARPEYVHRCEGEKRMDEMDHMLAEAVDNPQRPGIDPRVAKALQISGEALAGTAMGLCNHERGGEPWCRELPETLMEGKSIWEGGRRRSCGADET